MVTNHCGLEFVDVGRGTERYVPLVYTTGTLSCASTALPTTIGPCKLWSTFYKPYPRAAAGYSHQLPCTSRLGGSFGTTPTEHTTYTTNSSLNSSRPCKTFGDGASLCPCAIYDSLRTSERNSSTQASSTVAWHDDVLSVLPTQDQDLWTTVASGRPLACLSLCQKLCLTGEPSKLPSFLVFVRPRYAVANGSRGIGTMLAVKAGCPVYTRKHGTRRP